jgi:rfaE bifunctional protein nucleotidyltransferase chain/domain
VPVEIPSERVEEYREVGCAENRTGLRLTWTTIAMGLRDSAKKIVARSELKDIIRRLKAEGKRIAFTNGCFDLIQVHHVRCLQEARSHGDVLIVAINTDESVRKIKGPPRPIVPEEDRAEMLAALECVDYVTFFEEDTPHHILQEILPDVLAKGGDYGKDQVVGRKIVEGNGGKVVRLKKWPQRSTTRLIQQILDEHENPGGEE